MNKLLRLVLLLSITGCLPGLAQDPVLYEHTWYLHDLVIDGESIPPINLADAEFIPLFFDEDLPNDYNFRTDICGSALAEISFDDPNSSFSFLHGLDILECCCSSQITVEYGILYYNFFETEIEFPFVYNLTGTGSDLLLTILSDSGNRAVYGSQMLSLGDREISMIGLYPNPSNSEIYINSPNEPITYLELFTLWGEQIQHQKDQFDSMNISHLASGIYLLKISTKEGSTVKKIIKK